MLQIHAWLKDSFRAQGKPINFHVTEYKILLINFRFHIVFNFLETTTCQVLV